MIESDVRHDLYKALQQAGYWPVHGRDAILCPKCNTKILPKIGRPDLLILNPSGPTSVCEVKVVRLSSALSFSYTQIEPEQRRWLNAWTAVKGAGYLCIGTLEEAKRRIWVVPWEYWNRIEETYDGGFFPVDLALYTRRSRLVPGADLVGTCAQYQLFRDQGVWHIPLHHPLYAGGLK
jgi:hypothetical protein